MSLFRLLVMSVVLFLPLQIWGQGAIPPKYLPYDPITMTFPISLEQARQSAITWMGDPNLNLALTYVWWDGPGTESYIFESTDGRHSFYVDAYTGELWSWTDKVAAKNYVDKRNMPSPPPVLSEEQLLQAKRDFARLHYANFDTLNMVGTDWKWFYQQLPNNVYYLGNRCAVAVDEFDGTPYRYSGYHSSPVSISTTPTYNAAQAEQIALNVLAQAEYASTFLIGSSTLYVSRDFLGVQRLIWEVQTAGSKDAGVTFAIWQQEPLSAFKYYFHIDAHTGEVTYVDYVLGGGPESKVKPFTPRPGQQTKLGSHSKPVKGSLLPSEPLGNLSLNGKKLDVVSYRPLEREGTGYLYIKYLSSSLWNVQLQPQGKGQFSILHGGKRWTFTVGKKSVTVNGKSRRLSAGPVEVRGRTYLPAELVELITGTPVRWDGKAKTLDIRGVRFSSTAGTETCPMTAIGALSMGGASPSRSDEQR